MHYTRKSVETHRASYQNDVFNDRYHNGFADHNSYYVFYINGENVDKRFAKQFVDHVCNGKIRYAINEEQCTRKRLVLSSRHAAEQLLAVNRQVYWPDGSLFRCKLIRKPVLKPNNINMDLENDKYKQTFCKDLTSERTSSPHARRRWHEPNYYDDKQNNNDYHNKYKRSHEPNIKTPFYRHSIKSLDSSLDHHCRRIHKNHDSKRLKSLVKRNDDHKVNDNESVVNGNEDWYNSAAFVDIDLGGSDNIIATTNNVNGLDSLQQNVF
ncbi:LEF-6 [Chrysodeixis includens nucleopolyhedrovirus]|uniref:LEF-6 n=1 Tax=Chrysodeixis includens nucleopolyhedrovirus TaxID=1207438 RepID=A0A5B8YTI8_9ABAC|nr:LEF-6 [Chrysodeixis includens nucleopolyhedrovirus]QED40548.1 LEF-6 [Chrysodeixis includens nucleopolyhedrovirus]